MSDGSTPASAELHGRVAVVTGATSVLGSATAVRFGQLGATVVLVDRPGTDLEAVLASVHETGASAVAFHADVSRDEGNAAVAQFVEQSLGGAHVVFLTSGKFGPSPIREVSETQVASLIHANIHSVVFGMKHLAPLVERSTHADFSGSVIVNASVGSLMVSHAVVGAGVYSGTRAFIRDYVRTASREFAQRVRITAVAAGGVASPTFDAAGGHDAAVRMSKRVLERPDLVEGDSIADAVVHLATMAPGDATTGTVHVVENGRLLAPRPK